MPPISTIISKPQTDNDDDDDDDEKEEANQTNLQLSEFNFTDNLLAAFSQLSFYNFYVLNSFGFVIFCAEKNWLKNCL